MIVAMLTTYILLVWLVFYKLELIKASWKSTLVITIVGCVMIIALLFVCNYYQPYSTDVRLMQYTVPVVPRVTGRVIEVPVAPNEPLKAGDVLFRVDPEPFQFEVRRLEAELALRKTEVQQMDESQMAAASEVANVAAQLDILSSQRAAARATVDAAVANLVVAQDKIKVAEANVERARAEAEIQQIQYERTRQLVEDNVESESRLDELTRGLRTRKALLDGAGFTLTEARHAITVLGAQKAAAEAGLEQVDKTKARLLATLEKAKALERKARLELTPTIEGVHATVRRAEQQLANARWKLDQTTVRAPAAGFVTQVQLKPGVVASALPMNAVMVFVYDEKFLVCTFWQNAMRHVAVGQPVEIALDAMPGVLLTGTVSEILPVSGQGQAAPTGTLRTGTRGQPADHASVRIDFVGESPGPNAPAGGGGAVAVYPGAFEGTKIIRRVIINSYSWLNYVFN